MNIKLLKQVKDRILSHYHDFEMRDSSRSIEAIAIRLQFPQANFDENKHLVEIDGDVYSIFNYAQKLLDLKTTKLFYRWDWPIEFFHASKDAESNYERARITANLIDFIVKNGEF